ncbi:MAG TPA: GNAT family protein [Symbiobacteriaceae bacterium]|jgi:RimJ/RimL family protein N-acetyltransferase
MEWTPILIDLPEQLEGLRVLVRPYRLEDGPALWASIEESRAHLGAWLPWAEFHQTPDDTRQYVVKSQVKWLLREDMPVGLFDRITGRHVGGAGLHNIDWKLHSFEIGYWVRKSAEGQGYVGEAVRLLTRLAFDHLEANRVQIRMDARNLRSRAVAERQGFVFEGILRRALHPQQGETVPTDSCMFSLIREEYQALPWSEGD